MMSSLDDVIVEVFDFQGIRVVRLRYERECEKATRICRIEVVNRVNKILACRRNRAVLIQAMDSTDSERGCVVLDQPQHAGMPGGISRFQRLLVAMLLRLVFDTAALLRNVRKRPEGN